MPPRLNAWARRALLALGLGTLAATAHAQTPPPADCKVQPSLATEQVVPYTDYLGNGGTAHFWRRDKVCYGDGAVWWEPQLQLWLTQRASVYTPADPATEPPGTRRPVVIFTHPYGGVAVTEQFRYVEATKKHPHPKNAFADATLFQSVLVQAIQAGYTVVSLEFRHPLSSYDANLNAAPGNTDVRDAIQYLRYHAADFHIDPDNVFLVGQSRGSLNLLWAVQGDAAAVDPQRPWRAASSKVNAVWDYQPQTCYDRAPVLQRFILNQKDDRQAFLSDPKFPEPAGYQAGCAMTAAALNNASDLPPVTLMYDEVPVNTAAVTPQHYCRTDWDPKNVCWMRLGWHDADGIWNTWFDEHDANFGVALGQSYAQVSASSKFQVCYGVAVQYDDPNASGSWNGYRRYTDFFDQHRSVPVMKPTPLQCPVVAHKPPY